MDLNNEIKKLSLDNGQLGLQNVEFLGQIETLKNTIEYLKKEKDNMMNALSGIASYMVKHWKI